MVDFDKGFHDIHDRIMDMEVSLKQVVEHKARFDALRKKPKEKRSDREQREYEESWKEMKKRLYNIRSWCSYIVLTVNRMDLK